MSGLHGTLLLEMVVIELHVGPKSSPNLSPWSSPRVQSTSPVQSRVQVLHLPGFVTPPFMIMRKRDQDESILESISLSITSSIDTREYSIFTFLANRDSYLCRIWRCIFCYLVYTRLYFFKMKSGLLGNGRLTQQLGRILTSSNRI